MSSILYGCESWLDGNIKPMEKIYNMCIKHLLGVIKNITTSLCLIELGCPPLKALVKQRPRKFFKKMWAEREDMLDDPFSHVMHLMRNSNTSTARYITNLIGSDMDDVSQAMNLLHQEVTNSQSSRCTYYKKINPHLSVHDIYSTKCIVNENERISWSKLRLSAHSLVIETGRWNRRGRGRLPIEERLCQCGRVQTERHVFELCNISQDLRRIFNVTSLKEIVSERSDYYQVCQAVNLILNLYK